MNPLLALLSQQAAPESAEKNIDVIGQRKRSGGQANYDDYVLNNTEAVRNREADVKQTEEASTRKGMFGVKGTLRDILGLVGDAFLVQGGRNPIYAPQRQRERVADAYAGYSEDPVAASERVAYYDPKFGNELFDQAQESQYKTAQQKSLAASRDASIQDKELGRYRKARELIGGLFNTPGAVVNGQINPVAIQRAEQIARSAGLTLEDMLINEGMSEQEVRDYATSVLDPYKQERLEDYDVGLEQGQQRADASTSQAESSRIRANRPPAGRAPRAESDREAAIRIGNKPANERTAGERAFYEKYTRPPASSGRGGRPSKSRFRPATN